MDDLYSELQSLRDQLNISIKQLRTNGTKAAQAEHDYKVLLRQETKMGLRSRLLSLTSAHRSHSRKLLHKYKGKVPPETIRKMQSIHGKLMETLGVVDADCSLPEGEDLERLELRIGDLEDEWEALSSSEEGLEE